MITVFTPTYNRAEYLDILFESLKSQTCKNFEWVIVDDGSTDSTQRKIKEYVESEPGFPIICYRQENSGKHVAINTGSRLSTRKWFFIVDSDDYLVPDAISLIEIKLKKIDEEKGICGLTAMRITRDGEIMGRHNPSTPAVCNYFDYYHLWGNSGDRAHVILTSLVRENPFPVFKDEKFMTEIVLWNRVSPLYNAWFTTDRIYVGEYLPSGLTSHYRKLLDENPCGAALAYRIQFSHPGCTLFYRIKYSFFYHYFIEKAKEKGCDLTLLKEVGIKSLEKYKILYRSLKILRSIKKFIHR